MTARQKPRRSSPLNITGSFELYGKSKELVKKNLWIFIPLYLIPLLFNFHSWIWTPGPGSHQETGHWTRYSWLGSGFSTSSLPNSVWYIFVGFSILWLIFVIAAGTIVQIMAQNAQLEVAQGRTPTFGKLWATVKEMGWRMLGLYLLIGLYVVVGLILFIVPGLIMLRRYFLAPYVMLDQKTGIKESMEKSAAMSKPYSGYVWGVIGVMFLIGLLNVIPYLGWIAAFIIGMLYSVAPALRYQELKKLV